MNKKKLNTFKTEHPTIKEITIGDQFVTRGGFIVTFVEYDGYDEIYPIIMENNYGSLSIFAKNLMYNLTIENHIFDIKQRYITLKDKLDLL